jgi:hypothetical protein
MRAAVVFYGLLASRNATAVRAADKQFRRERATEGGEVAAF